MEMTPLLCATRMTDAPAALGVTDPCFMWPYHATEPSACWMYTAFHGLLFALQLRS